MNSIYICYSKERMASDSDVRSLLLELAEAVRAVTLSTTRMEAAIGRLCEAVPSSPPLVPVAGAVVDVVDVVDEYAEAEAELERRMGLIRREFFDHARQTITDKKLS